MMTRQVKTFHTPMTVEPVCQSQGIYILTRPTPSKPVCLSVHPKVYTPVEALCKGPAAALPVMVWIYGGGYWSGESNDYDGSTLVNASGNSVIVVTLNCTWKANVTVL